MADGVNAHAAGSPRRRGSRTVDQSAGLLIAASLLTVFYSVGIHAIRNERHEQPALDTSTW